MIVWVLVMAFNIYNGGGPLVIDNIASREDCQRLAQAMHQHHSATRDPYNSPREAVCVSVRKVKL